MQHKIQASLEPVTFWLMLYICLMQCFYMLYCFSLIMSAVFKVFSIAISILGWLLATKTVFGLSRYLSFEWLRWNGLVDFLCVDKFSCSQPFFAALLWNLGLLLLFVLQHSFMATRSWKNLFDTVGFGHVERSVYVIASCVTLNLVLDYFDPIPCLTVWNFHFMNSLLLNQVLYVVHVVLWAVVVLSTLGMQFFEFIGISQVFDYYRSPSVSPEVESHTKKISDNNMCHSGILCFVLILWLCPIMTVERFLVSAVFTLYALFGNRVTYYDYVEIKGQ